MNRYFALAWSPEAPQSPMTRRTSLLALTSHVKFRRLHDPLSSGRRRSRHHPLTHDLAGSRVAERVMVMYAGPEVRKHRSTTFSHPRHPYTQAFWARCPKLGSSLSGRETKLAEIPGVVRGLKQRIQGLRLRQPLRLGHRSMPASTPPLNQSNPVTSWPALCLQGGRLHAMSAPL